MKIPRKSKKIVVISALAAGALVVLLAAIANREALWLEWCRRQAAAECRRCGEDAWSPPDSDAWRSIFAAGERGYPHLARLLRDPDCRTWKLTSHMIDGRRLQEQGFLEALKGIDRLALLRYILPEAYGESTLWRYEAMWNEPWFDGREKAADPFAEGIALLEQVSGDAGAGQVDCWDGYVDGHLRLRAVRFLGSMLRPGETDRPAPPLAARVVGVLGNLAVSHTWAATRFAALVQLSQCSATAAASKSETRFLGYESEWDFDTYLYTLPIDLVALAHLDGSRTLRVMGRVFRNPEAGLRLEKILRERAPLGPVAMPDWLPLERTARRFLDGSPDERIDAALFLAEAGRREDRADVRLALAAESREEEKIILRACLVALGDESLRGEVRKPLEERASEGRDDFVRALGETLLCAGDRKALEILIGARFISIAYEEFVDGLPDPAKASNSSGPDRIKGLGDWWAANRDRVAWDPARQKFVVVPK